MRSVRELMDLRGRVALITGGAGHIGSTMAEALSEVGAAVVLADVEKNGCERTAAELQVKYGVETLPLVVEVRDEPALRSIPSLVLNNLGRLDILINAAALVGTSDLRGWIAPFNEQSSDTWRLALEVNLTASFVLAQACTPALEASGHGSIINLASIYGLVGPNASLYTGTTMGNPAAYAASKGGLIQLTRWLATVLAPKIRVNAITPGGIWRNQPSSFVERYRSLTPLARMATEEDLKGAAVYLASDLSSYVTGQNLIVDGGWTAW